VKSHRFVIAAGAANLPEDPGAGWMATDGGSLAALSARGCRVSVPEDYVAAPQVAQLCAPAYEAVRRFCLEMERRDPEGAGFFRLMLWPLGARVDGIVWRSAVVQKIREQHPGCDLLVWPPRRADSTGAAGWDLSWDCCSWQSVVTGSAGKRHSGAGPDPAPRTKFLGQWLRMRPALWSAVQARRHGLGPGSWFRAPGRAGGWIMFGPSYDWGAVLRRAAAEGRSIAFDDEARYFPARRANPDPARAGTPELTAGWRRLIEELPDVSAGAMAAVRDELAALRADFPAARRQASAVVGRTIRRGRPELVLNATSPALATKTALDLYRASGVPVAKWQHGSVWWHHRLTQRMDDMDTIGADRLLVYGPGAAEAYGRSKPAWAENLVPVGSSRLEELLRLRGGSPPAVLRPRHVLFSTTNFYRDEWYCGFSPAYMDVTSAEDQRTLAEGLLALVRANNALQVTFKLHPAVRPDGEPAWVREARGTARCRVAGPGESHAELSRSHDAVVVPCATTMLFESLCSWSAVFALVRSPSWSDEDLGLLRRRAVCAGEPASLLAAVRQFVATGVYGPDRGDSAFLGRHGTSPGATGRALAAVRSLAEAAAGAPGLHKS
jgi:hypothetical protein